MNFKTFNIIAVFILLLSFISYAIAEEFLWTEKTGIVWDAPITNADGTPLTDLSHFEIGIVKFTDDPNNGGQLLFKNNVECTDQECSEMLNAIRSVIADGLYKPVCRAVDTTGNSSSWAVTSDTLRKDTQPPSNVLNLRIVADVTLTITPPN